jgi:hypothetical protein
MGAAFFLFEDLIDLVTSIRLIHFRIELPVTSFVIAEIKGFS